MAAKALTANTGFGDVTEDAKEKMWLDALEVLLQLP